MKLPYDKMGMSIRLMLGTGMRSQELLALEPRHIEEDGSVIRIRQAVNPVNRSSLCGSLPIVYCNRPYRCKSSAPVL